MDSFKGRSLAVSAAGLEAGAAAIGATKEALWALLAVETAGCGFDPDRRPKILFERHIFHSLTNGRFDDEDPDVSAQTAGGYGASGEHQYLRLYAAIRLDRTAALSSASWGLGQIMGKNHQLAGYSTPDEMVAAFTDGEDAQLQGMIRFIGNTGIGSAVADKRWKDYARLYNGSNYAKNRYDERLQLACAQYEARGCPDVELRSAQVYLNYLGYDTGGIDGLKGNRTISALQSFQTAAAISVTGEPDDETLAALLEWLDQPAAPS